MTKASDYSAAGQFYNDVLHAACVGRQGDLERLLTSKESMGFEGAARIFRAAGYGLEPYLSNLRWLDAEKDFKFYEPVKTLSLEDLALYVYKAGELAAEFEGRTALTAEEVESLAERKDELSMYFKILSAYSSIAECEEQFALINRDLWGRMARLRIVKNVIGFNVKEKD
ncbi:hypothetical protein KY363_04275 [Candidatus Woesearchaeota archaeon]|nr:hypothetical protein [Candidatus Woesearchaeota archaeon]